VEFACPAPGATVGGKLAIPVRATAPAGIAAVTVVVDAASDADGGAAVTLCNFTAPPYTCNWDTTRESDGQYYLTVMVTDTHDQVTVENVLVNVSQSASSPCPETGDAGPGDGSADAGDGDASVGDGGPGDSGNGGSDASDGGPTPIADSGPAVDAAPHDASGTGAAGGDQSSSSGCSCDAVGRSSVAWGRCPVLLFLGLVAAAAVSRRSRRRLGPAHERPLRC
jgi:hypothetical protein